ncbi:MAG: hypothetical protein HY596_04405 [Candidatus Omnitrophica bacterium]|nr:hypothetical protein [Candidatus Omnitrophota bacterium]
MKPRWALGMVVGVLAVMPALDGQAAEHGGKEHAGHEHGGQAAVSPAPVKVEPTAEELRQTIRDHITTTAQKQGAFAIKDPVTGNTRTLTLVRVHERVGKTGDYYYSCTDMRDTASGELLDLDFDVEAEAGRLNVVDVRIHKVSGQARYTYDDHDQRVALQQR